MIELHVILEGDGAWPDLPDKIDEGKLRWFSSETEEQAEMTVTALSEGMSSGRPSVALRIDLPEGEVIVLETSMRLFLAAADVFRARYGAEV